MIGAWSFPLRGLSLGFSAAASPGPYQAYVIGLVLRSGWRRALPAAFAPLVTDGPIVALVLFILTQIPPTFLRLVQLAGGAFVLYLAWKTLQAYRQFQPGEIVGSRETRRSFWQAVLMNFLSPGPYLFWSLLAGPTLISGWKQSPWIGLSFLFSFYFGLIGGTVVLILMFGAARNLGPRVNRAMLGLSALALLGFGVYQFWQAVFAYN